MRQLLVEGAIILVVSVVNTLTTNTSFQVSLIGTTILVSIYPVGFFAAALVCSVMGVANIPGYMLWQSGVFRQNRLIEKFGMFLGWMGQTVVSLFFAVVLVGLGRLLLRYFEFWFLFRWASWVALFLLCLGPAYKTLRASEQTSQNGEERLYYSYTLSLTGLTTALGFIAAALLPISVI